MKNQLLLEKRRVNKREINKYLIGYLLLLLLPLNLLAQVQSIKVGTTTRQMIVYTPSGLEKDRPLVISMHGMNQTMNDQKNQTQFISVAQANKFVLVFPQAINNQWQLWGTADVDFILAIIESMYKQYGIDRDRVYLSGFSMGGMMTYYAATQIADKIAAFAPVSGFLMDGPNTKSSRPIPIIHIHGADDGYVPYANVQTHMKAWVTRNGCNATAQVTQPYPEDKLTSKSVKYYWAPGKSDVEVELIGVGGVGHWYSDDANNVFSSKEIWNFCKKYSLKFGIPVFKYASVTEKNPKQILLAFSESIADSGYFKGFSVKIDSQLVTIDSVVRADTNKLVINLSNAIINSNIISLSYSNGNVVSVLKKKLANFNDSLVDNLLKGASPRLTEVTTNSNGDSLFAKFNMKMHLPIEVSSLTLNAEFNGNKIIPVNKVTFYKNDSNILAFPLDSIVYRDYKLLLSYNGSNYVSADSGLLKNFINIPVTNCANGLPVHINSGKVEADGITLSIQFSKPMALESKQVDNFTFKVNGKIVKFTGFSVVSDTIKFTLSRGIHFNDTATLSYLPGTIKAADNGPLESLNNLVIDHLLKEPVWIEVPGKIEAEKYSSQWGIQTENTGDTGGGLNIGWVDAGDWLEYPIVNNTSETNYQVSFRVSAPGNGGAIEFFIDDKSMGKITVPTTGNWQVYNSVDANITVSPGKHYLKVVATSAGFNLNHMEVHELRTSIKNSAGIPTIYPNPVSNQLNINSGNFNIDKVELFDVTGKLVISKLPKEESELYIPVHLPDGIYILKISNATNSLLNKVVIVNK